MPNPSWGYHAPKFRAYHKDDELTKLVADVSREAQRLAGSSHFTDEGRAASFAESVTVKMAIKDIDDRLAKARTERARITKDREALRIAARPPAASLAERLEILELARAVRDNPERRQRLLERVVKRDPSEAERRLQIAFLNTFPELWNLDHESYHVRVQQLVQPELGAEGEKLDTEEAELQDVEATWREAKLSIIRAADRAILERDGFLPRPPQQWTTEERRAFVDKHGHEKYRELIWEEHAIGATLLHDDARAADEAAAEAAATAKPPTPAAA